jgi:hypothetical protein
MNVYSGRLLNYPRKPDIQTVSGARRASPGGPLAALPGLADGTRASGGATTGRLTRDHPALHRKNAG